MTYNTQQLALLFIEAIDGSQDKSREFVSIMTPYVKKILSEKGVSQNDIDDVTQEVFIRLFNHGRSFDPQKGTITGWVSAVSNRTSVDCYRKNKKHKNGIELVDEYELKDDTKKEKEKSYFLFSAVNAIMSQRERDFVKLYFFKGHSYEECSRVMNVPVGTLKSAMSRMYSRLRRIAEERKEVLFHEDKSI